MNNGNLPAWTRVGFAAFQRVDQYGIAEFRPGELAEVAGKTDEHTGEIIPLSNARREVNRAVANGWLADGSSTTRLLVPDGVLQVGKVNKAAA